MQPIRLIWSGYCSALSELHIPVSFCPTAESTYPGHLQLQPTILRKLVFTVVLTGAGKAAGALSYELTGGQVNTRIPDQLFLQI